MSSITIKYSGIRPAYREKNLESFLTGQGYEPKIITEGVPDILIFGFTDSEYRKAQYDQSLKYLVSTENVFEYRTSIPRYILAQYDRFKSDKVLRVGDYLSDTWLNNMVISRFKDKRKFVRQLGGQNFSNIPVKVEHDHNLNLPYFLEFVDQDKLNNIESVQNAEGREFCAFIVSNPIQKERNQLFRKLSRYKKVDSFGRLYNNAALYLDSSSEHQNNEIFQRYKFAICFENSIYDNYITEKLVNVMAGGAIPIYMGAPNVGQYFNPESFILVKDGSDLDQTVERIIDLDQNDDRYLRLFNQEFLQNKGHFLEQAEVRRTDFYNQMLQYLQKK